MQQPEMAVLFNALGRMMSFIASLNIRLPYLVCQPVTDSADNQQGSTKFVPSSASSSFLRTAQRMNHACPLCAGIESLWDESR